MRFKLRIIVFSLATIVSFSTQSFATDETNSTLASPTSTSVPKAELGNSDEVSHPKKNTLATDHNSNSSEPRKWRLGPTVTFSFPRISEYALEYKPGNDFFSLGISYGGFDSKLDSDKKLSFKNYELRGRWHPFMGSFFLGLGYGKQNLKVDASKSISSVNVTYNFDIESSYVFPHMGWFKVFDSGFTYGFDFGVISPSGVKTKTSSNAPTSVQSSTEYTDFKKSAEDAGNKLGKVSLPYLGLVKLGWLF